MWETWEADESAAWVTGSEEVIYEMSWPLSGPENIWRA